MKHPQCQGCCWCAPGGPGGGNSSPALFAELSREQRTLGPHATLLPPRAHPRGWHATLRRRCSCDPEPACPRGQGWAPCIHWDPQDPSLKPVTRTASGGYGGVGRGIGSASSSPTYPKNSEVHLWPDLNLWSTDYWPRDLGGESWERSPEPCALSPALSP